MAEKLLNQQERIVEARKRWQEAKVITNLNANLVETHQLRLKEAKEREYERLNIYLAELETFASEVR